MGQSLTPRQIRSLQNIDRLVKTAITMFQQQGYDAVTIDDICAECGMSKGVFYYRFRSKEDLVAYAHKNFCDDHVSQQMKYDESQPLRTQLKDYLTAQLDFSKAFGKLLIARGLQGMFPPIIKSSRETTSAGRRSVTTRRSPTLLIWFAGCRPGAPGRRLFGAA